MFVYAEACPPLPNTTTITGVGSSGYAGDLTPPNIYVEGILICISP